MNGYSKGEKNGLTKLENFTNKDIIKEEAEILTNLLDDITKNLARRKPLIKLGSWRIIKNTELSWVESTSGTIDKWRNDSDFTLFCYFTTLINISEDVDLAYEINHLNNVDGEYLGKLSSTIKEVAKMKMHKKFLKISILYLF